MSRSRRRGRWCWWPRRSGTWATSPPGPGRPWPTADVICCEDTRRTRALLSAVGVAAGGPGGDRLLSLHDHNEEARLSRVAAPWPAGATVAVVTDAGTPASRTPARGWWPLAAAGGAVSVVPGPSSVLAALVVSGLPTDRFCVEGFLPRKGAERRRRIGGAVAEERTSVVLEAPGRVAATLAELAALDPERPVAVVRELTKLHEEVWRGTLARRRRNSRHAELRGEVVLVIGGAPAPGAGRRRGRGGGGAALSWRTTRAPGRARRPTRGRRSRCGPATGVRGGAPRAGVGRRPNPGPTGPAWGAGTLRAVPRFYITTPIYYVNDAPHVGTPTRPSTPTPWPAGTAWSATTSSS